LNGATSISKGRASKKEDAQAPKYIEDYKLYAGKFSGWRNGDGVE